MSRSLMLVLSTVAAGALGYGVAQARITPRQTSGAAEAMFAKCNSNGALSTTSRRAKFCSVGARGTYTVGFDRSVRGCALQTTSTSGNGFDVVQNAGTTAAYYKYENEKAVTVIVRDRDRNLANISFYLTVNC